MVPLAENLVFADVFAQWQIPVILCARTTLGTINHTLLSIEAMHHRAIPIFGIAFIGEANPETETVIARLSGVRPLGRLPILASLKASTVSKAFMRISISIVSRTPAHDKFDHLASIHPTCVGTTNEADRLYGRRLPRR